MISQKRVNTNQKKGGQTMYRLNYKISIQQYDKKQQSIYYKELDLYYIKDIIETNILMIVLQKHNEQEYNKDIPYKEKTFYNLEQLRTLYNQKPTAKKQLIIHKYIDQAYQNYQQYIEDIKAKQEEQNIQKLIQHNQKQIIVPKLQNLTNQQVEQIATKLQELEEQYYLQLDTDYSDKQSIIRNYQQYLYYIKCNIELQPRETEEILVGNTELLEKGATQY